MLHVTRDLCTCPGRSLLPLAAWGDTVDTNSEPDTTNKEACAVLRQPGWLMNGLVNAAQPFAGMDLLWESGRRAGQVFLSTAQSAVWVTEGVLDPPCFPGWDSSRLDLSPVKILLAPGVSAGRTWDWGCLAPAEPASAVRGRERGPAPGVLPIQHSQVSVGLLGLVL